MLYIEIHTSENINISIGMQKRGLKQLMIYIEIDSI